MLEFALCVVGALRMHANSPSQTLDPRLRRCVVQEEGRRVLGVYTVIETSGP